MDLQGNKKLGIHRMEWVVRNSHWGRQLVAFDDRRSCRMFSSFLKVRVEKRLYHLYCRKH